MANKKTQKRKRSRKNAQARKASSTSNKGTESDKYHGIIDALAGLPMPRILTDNYLRAYNAMIRDLQ